MERSYIGPPFADAKVSDAMRVGVITCRPETTLNDVASMMVGYDAHSIVVAGLGDEGGASQWGIGRWGIVTSLDIARHARKPGSIEALTAGEVATTEVLTIRSDETLEKAAQLMSDSGISHLIAVQPDTGRPAGVISARTITAVVAHGGS